MGKQQESSCQRWINVNLVSIIKAAGERGASVLRLISSTQETIDSEIYGERRGGRSCSWLLWPPPLLLLWLLLLPLFLSQSKGSSSEEINRSERREEKTFLPPLPLTICPSSSSPFFHGEELSRCRLWWSRGWDGMELRQIGQSKVSFGGQSVGTQMLFWVHQCA